MNSRSIFAIILGGLIIGGIYSYPWLSWKYWHWRNRHILRLQGYQIRVPDSFLVGTLNSDSAVIVDNAPRHVGGRLTYPQITFLHTLPDPDLRADLAADAHLDQNAKLLPIDAIAGEKARCHTDRSLAVAVENENVVSVRCVTEGGLLILLSGMKEDLSDLLKVVRTTTRSN